MGTIRDTDGCCLKQLADVGAIERRPDRTYILGRSADTRSWASALFRDAEEHGTVVFDTARGDRLRDWRQTVPVAANGVRDNGQPRRF